MSKSVLDFLKTVSEEKRGWRLGEPRRLGEDSLAVVVPIHRAPGRQRQYVLLSEADDVKVTDTGSIHQFLVKNPTDRHVYLCAGTVFSGATQERALTRSAVVFAGQEAKVEVRCVHASKGIRGGTEVKYGGVTPLEMDQKTHTKGFAPKGQGDYWGEVKKYSQTVTQAGLASTPGPEQNWSRVNYVASGMIFHTPVGGAGADPDYNSPVSYGTTPPTGEGWKAHTQGDTSFASDRQWYSRVAAGGGQELYCQQPPRAKAMSWLNETTGGALGAPPATQQPLLGAASNTLCSAADTVKADDLHSVMGQVANSLDAVLRQVELLPEQVGLAFLNDKGLQTVGLFDTHESWKALHGDAVKRLGASLAAKDANKVFEYKADAAKSAVAAVLADDYEVNTIYEHKPSNGEPPLKIFGLTSERFVGEVVELDGHVIHLVLNRVS